MLTPIFIVKNLILVSVSLFIVITFVKIVVDSYGAKTDPSRFRSSHPDTYFWKSQWDNSSLGKVTVHVYDPALQMGKIVYLNEFLRDQNASHCFVGTYTLINNLNSEWSLRGTRPKKSKLREYAASSAQHIYTEARSAFDSSAHNCDSWIQQSW